jgi:hypothetical protein
MSDYPEVTNTEQRSGISSDEEELKRGLLFVGYQADLNSGFIRQTVGYDDKLVPKQNGMCDFDI